MGNIVAARRLRKSMLKDFNYKGTNTNNLYNLGYCNNDILPYSNIFEKNIECETNSTGNDNRNETKILYKLKNKIILKIFATCLILFLCLTIKLTCKEKVLQNKYVNILIKEYNKDYSKRYALEKIEEILNNNYESIGKYVIPSDIKEKVVGKYVGNVKPFIESFCLKDILVKESTEKKEANLYDTSTENVASVYNGNISKEPIETDAYFEDSSAVSMMQDDVSQILSKNIDVIKPISGTITSLYGARDQIFKGVNSYHTGLDIAAKAGTDVKSVCNGKVVKVQKMDKYYGNYVVVENNEVRFKYAHMKEIKVKLNDEIKQGHIVGTVGSTGMSTGPHLHLEISINSRTVDPQNIIKF